MHAFGHAIAMETHFLAKSRWNLEIQIKPSVHSIGEGLEMKFLVLQRIRVPTVVKDYAVLLPAQIKYYEELKASGKVEAYYHMIGQQGHALICNVASDDELSAIIGRDPLFFLSYREVYPLTTAETHKKYVQEMIGR